MTTKVERSIQVDVPVTTAYDQWTQFEDFPHFMGGVKEVRQLDDRRLHWVAEIAGVRREWEASILEQVPDQKIAWAATAGATNAGAVRFDPAGPSSTVVHLTLEYEPEGVIEQVGDKLGIVERQVRGRPGAVQEAGRGPGLRQRRLAGRDQRRRRRRDARGRERRSLAGRQRQGRGLRQGRRGRGRCRGRRRGSRSGGGEVLGRLGGADDVGAGGATAPARRVDGGRRDGHPRSVGRDDPARRSAGARRGRLGPRPTYRTRRPARST